jgi:hypothetical protein
MSRVWVGEPTRRRLSTHFDSETRLEKMEKLLNKLLPGIDLTEQLEQEESSLPSEDSLPRNDSDADELLGAMQKLSLNPETHRFFGKSR